MPLELELGVKQAEEVGVTLEFAWDPALLDFDLVFVAQEGHPAGSVFYSDSVAVARDDQIDGWVADGDDAFVDDDFELVGLAFDEL